MRRISSPCRIGDLRTMRPFPTPRANSPARVTAMDAPIATLPSAKKWGRTGIKAATMKAAPMVTASLMGLDVISGLIPNSFSTRVRSHRSLSEAMCSVTPFASLKLMPSR